MRDKVLVVADHSAALFPAPSIYILVCATLCEGMWYSGAANPL